MKVAASLAVSVDGRIAAHAGTASLGSARDLDRLHRLRAGADAILAGGNTLRAWPLAWVEDPARVAMSPARGDRPLLNVVLTRGGIPLDAPRFWHDPRTLPLVLSVSDIAVPRGDCVTRATWTPRDVLEELASRGVRTLLLEGGGGLLGPFLEAGLVDTLHITLCPLLLGGGPMLVSGVPPWTRGGAPRLRLVSALPVGDEVFLTYVRADGYDPLPGPPGDGDPR